MHDELGEVPVQELYGRDGPLGADGVRVHAAVVEASQLPVSAVGRRASRLVAAAEGRRGGGRLVEEGVATGGSPSCSSSSVGEVDFLN